MVAAEEVTFLPPRYAIWSTYDSAVKAELFSTALIERRGLTFIDPVPLAAKAHSHLIECGQPLRIMVTSANHARASGQLAEQYSVPVFAAPELHLPGRIAVEDQSAVGGLQTIRVPGAAAGEFAFYDSHGDGAVIVGDALINFEELSILPAKYCSNQKQLARSLERLLNLRFQSLFFAHGHPILSGARERLAAVLAEWS